MRTLFVLLAMAMLLGGCGNAVYNEHKQVNTFLVWKSGEAITFEVPIADASKAYNLVAAIRHATGVDLTAIKVQASIVGAEGFSKEGEYTVAIKDKEGNLMGSAAGDICDTEAVMLSNFKFPKDGLYTFTLSPVVEGGEEGIGGIMEVGLVVEPAEGD